VFLLTKQGIIDGFCFCKKAPPFKTILLTNRPKNKTFDKKIRFFKT